MADRIEGARGHAGDARQIDERQRSERAAADEGLQSFQPAARDIVRVVGRLARTPCAAL